jgi:hypothetical protein
VNLELDPNAKPVQQGRILCLAFTCPLSNKELDHLVALSMLILRKKVNGHLPHYHPKKGWTSSLDQQSSSTEQIDQAQAISFANHNRYPAEMHGLSVLHKTQY